MRSEDQLATKEGITCSLNDSFKKFIYWIDESSSKNSQFIWLLRLRRNNQIEFMNLPKSEVKLALSCLCTDPRFRPAMQQVSPELITLWPSLPKPLSTIE
ncbi:hypothetical protein SADUNF_Sadunf12G0096300 [Salix dunnii]|uniref:Uncharacterized protein n=1 Tax=Salix dunnii TaxID=1413687 RepID=A0A835JIK0_9ROSI|nr:hypothetical protein SADUNF_Sadunf12G0096300 [Salix dunnii]